jgi:hypothetical protein
MGKKKNDIDLTEGLDGTSNTYLTKFEEYLKRYDIKEGSFVKIVKTGYRKLGYERMWGSHLNRFNGQYVVVTKVDHEWGSLCVSRCNVKSFAYGVYRYPFHVCFPVDISKVFPDEYFSKLMADGNYVKYSKLSNNQKEALKKIFIGFDMEGYRVDRNTAIEMALLNE